MAVPETNPNPIILVTDSSGIFITPTVSPVWSSLKSYASDNTATDVPTSSLNSLIQSTGVVGQYFVDLKGSGSPFYATGSYAQKRFVGIIDCGKDASPQYQAFEFRYEDYVNNTSTDVTAILTKVNQITSKSYYFSGTEVGTSALKTWKSTDPNSSSPEGVSIISGTKKSLGAF